MIDIKMERERDEIGENCSGTNHMKYLAKFINTNFTFVKNF